MWLHIWGSTDFVKWWLQKHTNDTRVLHVRLCHCVICRRFNFLFPPPTPSYSPHCCVLICTHSLFLSPAVAPDLLFLQFASLWNKRWPLQPHLLSRFFYGLHILFGIWAVASWKGQTSQFPCQQIQSAVTLHKNIRKTTRPPVVHSLATSVRQRERGSLSACLISLHLLNVHLKVCTLDGRHLHIVSVVAA